MAHESRNGGDIPGLIAGVDLSDKQYRLCELDADGNVVMVTAAGGPVLGVVTNKPGLGDAATMYGTGCIMKVVAGGNIPPQSEVAVDADGKAAVAVAGNYVIGLCLEAAAAADELCSVYFHGGYIKA